MVDFTDYLMYRFRTLFYYLKVNLLG